MKAARCAKCGTDAVPMVIGKYAYCRCGKTFAVRLADDAFTCGGPADVRIVDTEENL